VRVNQWAGTEVFFKALLGRMKDCKISEFLAKGKKDFCDCVTSAFYQNQRGEQSLASVLSSTVSESVEGSELGRQVRVAASLEIPFHGDLESNPKFSGHRTNQTVPE